MAHRVAALLSLCDRLRAHRRAGAGIVIALVVSFVPGCGGTTASPGRTASPGTVFAPTTASPISAATVACSPAGVLSTWSVQRLAEQTVVVPVGESDVASVASEVAAGVEG